MSIYMVGIDHSQADIDVRSLFSFTKKNMLQAMSTLQENEQVEGCIILSTCNRMEVWVNTKEDWNDSLYEMLCEIKSVDSKQYQHFFQERWGEEAVDHLFHLACGLKSQILGEDQIVTQVGDALKFARENGYTDSVLEVLFRKAVTAAKKVKTEVIFPKGNASAIDNAIGHLKKDGYTIEGKRCMVIGNGEMGKLAANAFVKEKAVVEVTVRQYRHGFVDIPEGCVGIDYNDRQSRLCDCAFVVSATTSPHHTITSDMIPAIRKERDLIFIDLAVPRDIEPEVRQISGVQLFNIDDFKANISDERLILAKEKAEIILQSLIHEFYDWLNGHDVISRIQFVKEEAVNDLNLRLSKYFRGVALEDYEKQELVAHVDKAADKVINKMIFGLRDALPQEAFLECMSGLEQLYEE